MKPELLAALWAAGDMVSVGGRTYVAVDTLPAGVAPTPTPAPPDPAPDVALEAAAAEVALAALTTGTDPARYADALEQDPDPVAQRASALLRALIAERQRPAEEDADALPAEQP